MEEASAVVLGVGFLHVFFRAVESQWPTSYFALSSGPDYAITRSLGRYLAFRLIPVFVVSVFVAVTLARRDRAVVVPAVIVGALHGLLTSGRALVGVVRSKRLSRRPLLGLMHPAVILAVILVSLAGGVAAVAFEPIVPSVEDVGSDLWTGLIAGVVGAYAVRVSQQTHIDTEVVFRESRRAIPRELWDLAGDLAPRFNADPQLIRAVMLVENIQRPRWFRTLERVGSKVLNKPATLGLLQAAGDAKDSDAVLLERAIAERFAGVWTKDMDGRTNWDAIEAFASAYNPDPAYLDLLSAALHEAADR